MKLHFVNGPEAGHLREVPLSGFRIGRETDNDISILSGGLSRYHAIIARIENEWTIQDLQSTNGTKLNGISLDNGPAKLKNGDLCTLGDQVFRVEMEPADFGGQTSDVAASPVLIDLQNHSDAAVIDLRQSESTAAPMINLQTGMEPVSVELNPIDPPVVTASPQDISALNSFNLFGGKDHAKKSVEEGDDPDGKGSRLGNIIFISLVSVAVLVIMAIAVVLVSGKESANGRSGTKVTAAALPTTMIFERQYADKLNIFRFFFRLEQGRAVRAKIVDLTSGIAYDTNEVALFPPTKDIAAMPPWPERKKALERLEDAISQSQFMTLQTLPANEPNAKNFYRVSICYNNQLNSLDDFSNNPPAAVYAIENAINAFVNDVLKIPISKPPKEARDDAERYFQLGEEKFLNWQAAPENLKTAIRFFKMTQDALSLFNPKPEVYMKAETLSKEAQKLKDAELHKLRRDADQAFGLHDYQRALRDQTLILKYLDEETDAVSVKNTRENIAAIQHLLSGR